MENCIRFLVNLDVDNYKGTGYLNLSAFYNEYTFPAVLLVVLCNVSNEKVNIFTMLSKSWSGNIGKPISPSTNCISHK